MMRLELEKENIWKEKGILDLVKFHECLTEHGGKDLEVIFPKNKYTFDELYEDGAFFLIRNCSDLIIDGQGSSFEFSEIGHYFKLEYCENITLKNIVLDWHWEKAPLASVGIVENVTADGHYIDVLFPHRSHIEASVDIRMVGPLDPLTYSPGVCGGVEFRPFVNPHLPLEIQGDHSQEMKEMVRELDERFIGITKIASNKLRFRMKECDWTKEWIKEGQAYHFRHFEYDTVGVLVERSCHIHLEDIQMYSCPGSGFVVRNDIHDYSMNRCKVVLKPGTTRTITTTADALHIANTQGGIRVENCEFSRSGDDCINFHDNTLMGFKVVERDQLLFEGVEYDANPLHEGDLLEFRKTDFSGLDLARRLESVQYDQDQKTCFVKLEKPLPNHITGNEILWNKRYNTKDFVIRNNTFYENRARALLIHGSNGVVEGNRFYKIQGSAIQVESGAEVRWAEGMGVDNVVIRNNVFESCNLNGWNMATLYVGVYLPSGRTNYPIFNHIEIMNNTFVDGPKQAIFISSAHNVKIHHNVILNYLQQGLNNKDYGSSQSEFSMYNEVYEGAIQDLFSKDVELWDNQLINSIPLDINKKELL